MSGMTVSCWERLSGHRLAHYKGWCTNSRVTRLGGRWTKSEHNVWEQAPNLTGNNIVWVGQQSTYSGERLLHVLCERSGEVPDPSSFQHASSISLQVLDSLNCHYKCLLSEAFYQDSRKVNLNNELSCQRPGRKLTKPLTQSGAQPASVNGEQRLTVGTERVLPEWQECSIPSAEVWTPEGETRVTKK